MEARASQINELSESKASESIAKHKIVQTLIQTNFEFKHLHKEHESLETKIDTIDKKKYLSVDDEQLRKELQKKKLVGRDRMEEILRQYQSACE